MPVSVRVVVVLTAVACLGTLVTGAADARRTKQQRPTRGFKNLEMMTARGFGKRDRPHRPERDVSDVESQSASERANRGTPTFKSPSVGIARDFGKRTPEPGEEYYWREDLKPPRRRYNPKTTLMVAPDFGKRSSGDNSGEAYDLDRFWEVLESAPENDSFGKNDNKALDSIPMDWFVNEIVNNPDFARSVVRKFVDINQDGLLSSEELIRNVV